jgi:putative ABC transport system ATP-binding protein
MDAATMPAGVPAVAVSGLGKTFAAGSAAVVALEDVTLAVDPGEFVLLMGPSGSGKTTLLSIMGCLLRPTAGSVRVAGREITGLGEKELARIRLVHLGFIFQSYNLFPTLTARENVMVALDLKAVSRAEAKEQAAEVMGMVGLGDKLASYPGDLSGGQKQRLAIARALAGRPGIILADEPTAALDSKSGRNVMTILHDLAKTQGRAVVIVTHDNRILDFADRIVRIEDGRIGDSLSVAE